MLIWLRVFFNSFRVDFPSRQLWNNRSNRECLKYFPYSFVFDHWIVRKNPDWNLQASKFFFLDWALWRTKNLNWAAASIWVLVLFSWFSRGSPNELCQFYTGLSRQNCQWVKWEKLFGWVIGLNGSIHLLTLSSRVICIFFSPSSGIFISR